MLKLADSIQMAFPITESDKANAMKAEEYLLSILNYFEICKDHLDIIQNAFTQFQNISPELLHKKRGVLYRYKKQVKENFDEILKEATLAVYYLKIFDSDNHIASLKSSLEEDLKEEEKSITALLDILDDYKNPDFRDNVLKSIQNIDKLAAQIKQLIKDRMITYLDDNILDNNWQNKAIENSELTLEERKPELIQIFEDAKAVPQVNKRPQSLNPADNQRVYTPTDIREVGENDDVGRNIQPITPNPRRN